MILKNPSQVRQMFAERKKWLTIEEIATGLDASTRTVSRALNGKSMRPTTVRQWAQVLSVDETEIATFVNAN